MEAVREQFEDVFERHLPEVKRLVGRRIANPDDAADLVQEVFVRAYSAYDSFSPGTNTGAWLYRIAINVCANAAKANIRYRKYVSQDAHEWDIPAQMPDTADTLAREHDQHQLRQAMRSLSSDQILVLTLRFSDGLTLPEIAQVLAIPLDTAKSRLRSALAKLQSSLSYASLDAAHPTPPAIEVVQGVDLDGLLIYGQRGARIYHSLGSLYLRKGLIAAALGEWARAQQASPDFLDAYLDSAQGYVALDQPKKAVDTLETAVTKIKSADLHVRLAGLYLDKMDDINEGMRHSTRAIDLEPQNPHAHFTAGKVCYRHAHYEQNASWTTPNRELILDQLITNWKTSASHLEEAIHLNGTYPKASAMLGISYFWQDRVDDALRESLAAANQAEEDNWVLYHTGLVHYLAHDYELAEDHLRKSLTCQFSPGTWLLLCQVFIATGRYQEAYDGYLQALSTVKNSENRALVYANLASQAVRLGNYDLAIEHAEDGLLCYPNHIHCRCNLAEAHQRKGSPPHIIINLCVEGLTIDPTHRCFHRILAEAYYRQGKYDDALLNATTAVEVEPEKVNNWLLRAKILAKLDQYDEARQDVMTALDLEPDNEETKSRLAEVEKALQTT